MKIIFTVVLLFFWQSICAEIRPEYSGMWYNPEQDGHGLNLEVLSDGRTAGFWYLYDADGEPFWLLLEGVNSNHNRIEMLAYRFSGMIMGEWDPSTNRRSEWGAVLIQVADCNHATVSAYQNGQGEWGPIEMERLTHIAGLKCVDPKPESVTLKQILGDWKAKSGYYLNDVTVQADGKFEYFTTEGCRWSGEIKIDETDPSFLSISYVQDTCHAPYGPFLKSGRLYTDYLWCYSVWPDPLDFPGVAMCDRSAEVMVFEPCLDPPTEVTLEAENLSPCDLEGVYMFARPF